MVLQSSGAIKFSDIQTEFGGTNPISLSEYYSGGTYVAASVSVAASGAIVVGTFRGKAKATGLQIVSGNRTAIDVTTLPAGILLNGENDDSTFTLTLSGSTASAWIFYVAGVQVTSFGMNSNCTFYFNSGNTFNYAYYDRWGYQLRYEFVNGVFRVVCWHGWYFAAGNKANTDLRFEFKFYRDSTYQYIEAKAADSMFYSTSTSTQNFQGITLPQLTAGTSYVLRSDLNGNNWTLFSTAYMSSASPLYSFTSHTFTNAGATGASGPSLAQVQTAYSGQTWAQNTTYLNVSGGMQIWTVPSSRIYTITARGARGGKMSSNYTVGGGFGATISASFALTQGEQLYLVVGQMGNGNTSGSGGGGGSWVVRSTGTLLLVAGGGGGAGHDTGWGAGGSTSTAANNTSGGHGCNTNSTVGYGGDAGLRGPDNIYNYGGAGGGGAGWLSDGSSVSSGTGSGGLRYANGAVGGAQTQAGGFGGGGGAGGTGFAGGGGGGYTGGGGGNDYGWGDTSATTGDTSGSTNVWGGGGGGGSYYSGTFVSATVGANGNTDNTTDQHGYITIQ